MADIVNRTKTSGVRGSFTPKVVGPASDPNLRSAVSGIRRSAMNQSVEGTLAGEIDELERQQFDNQVKGEGIETQYLQRVDQFLKGELFDVPPATLDALEKNIEAAYGPEYADLKAQGVKLSNLIQEEGVQAINKLKEIRASSEKELSMFSDEERQKVMDMAAASGRGPTDPQLLREFGESIGKAFSTTQAGLVQAERNVADTTRERLGGVQRATMASEQLLGAQKAAAKAGQKFSLQTGLPLQQIQTGAAAQQLANALNTQNMANQISTIGGIQGVVAPLTQNRLSQPTTTQTTHGSPFDVLSGIVGAGSKIAGGFLA